MTYVQPPFRGHASPSTSSRQNGDPSRAMGDPSGPPLTEADRVRMDTFRRVSPSTLVLVRSVLKSQVRPTCVALMKIGAQAPTSYSTHAGILDKLTEIITSIPSTSFTPDIINFLLLPVTQILRHHDPLLLPDNFLESVFRLLALVVRYWKDQRGGMDIGAWEQLWRFTTASIAPRVVDAGKGKGKKVGQEVQLQAVLFLTELLEPKGIYPTKEMLEKVGTAKSPLMPTLFQTITLLLALVSPIPTHNDLQISSLRLLRPLVSVYLQGQSSVLASVLPGTISAIAKLFNASGKTMKGNVAAGSAGLVEHVIVATLADEDLRKLRILRSDLEDLSQLGEEWEEDKTPRSPSPTPSTSTSSGKDPFPPLSTSYLDFTSTQLRTTLRPILSALSSHASHLARLAAASLSSALLTHCSQSLPQLSPFSLSTLLQLSQDDFDIVQTDAREKLRSLLDIPNLQLDQTLIDLLSDAMNALPRMIVSHQETKVEEAAKLLTAIAQSTIAVNPNPITDLLGPRGKVERWGWALLDCLEFGRPSGWSAMGDTAARTTEKGWTGGFIMSSTPLLLEGGQPIPDSFTQLPLRYVESDQTIKAIKNALVQLGVAGGEVALHSVDHFVSLARSHRSRDPARAASALLVAQQLMDGISRGQEEGAEGKVGKATRKMAKEITRIIVTMDEDDADDDDDYVGEDKPTVDKEDSIIPVERQKGLDVVTTLLDRPLNAGTHAAKETRRLYLQSQRVLMTALSLQTLSTTSRILSSSFRPLLLTVLYTLLSHLASPHHLIASYAETALSHVAYNTGYASVQNLILDNVDYVINVVSQRLTPSRLSPNAPLVLIAMIRLTRSEIVPLVHDIVDEIFDALDDYHGYEVLTSGLLAVLVTLVDAMADDVATQGPSAERLEKLKELKRLGKPPNPEADFDRFKHWWAEKEKRRHEEVNKILERAPEHAWGKKDDAKPEEEEVEAANDPHDDGEIPPTRSQEITTQILDKSLNFLSHNSPFLRARILSLIARAVPVLAAGNREGDLLPLIDRSWGIILLRLDDALPYVVTEAAEVVASLCEHVGDFMSRRILDTVWPKLQKIVSAQKIVDDRSALTRKGAMGTTSQWTVSHRLYMAILSISTYVAREVPVDDGVLWDMMVLFTPFLDERVHEEIQAKAVELYKSLVIRDEDAVWLVLETTRGRLEGGVWGHLADPSLDIGINADRILANA